MGLDLEMETKQGLAKLEETACSRGALWAGLGNCTLKRRYLPSRDREGAVTLPSFASPSEVCPTTHRHWSLPCCASGQVPCRNHARLALVPQRAHRRGGQCE